MLLFGVQKVPDFRKYSKIREFLCRTGPLPSPPPLFPLRLLRLLPADCPRGLRSRVSRGLLGGRSPHRLRGGRGRLPAGAAAQGSRHLQIQESRVAEGGYFVIFRNSEVT